MAETSELYQITAWQYQALHRLVRGELTHTDWQRLRQEVAAADMPVGEPSGGCEGCGTHGPVEQTPYGAVCADCLATAREAAQDAAHQGGRDDRA
jgi:hypothetical protein